MHVEFFGCRGSIPSPLNINQLNDVIEHLYKRAIQDDIQPEHFRAFLNKEQNRTPYFHGGNTSSNIIQHEDDILILEAGSGLREIGNRLVREGRTEFHILMGHFHWDHIQGFPFFVPAFIPGNTIHLYSVQPLAEDAFKKQMSAPTFPVPFDALASEIHFHQLTEGEEIDINGFQISTLRMNHPDECWGYRIERLIDTERKRICYLSDTEITNAPGNTIKDYGDFVGNADIVIADSQYTFVEYFNKQDWGHSNITTFIDIFRNKDVKQLIMYHHDPMANFKEINEQLEIALKYQELTNGNPNMKILSAREGMILEA